MEDSELITLYEQRDESLFELISQKYGKYVHFIADNILGDTRDSEECVDDAYLALWNSIPPHRPESLKAYLARLTRNIALDALRKISAAKRGGDSVSQALDELKASITAITKAADRIIRDIENCQPV